MPARKSDASSAHPHPRYFVLNKQRQIVYNGLLTNSPGCARRQCAALRQTARPRISTCVTPLTPCSTARPCRCPRRAPRDARWNTPQIQLMPRWQLLGRRGLLSPGRLRPAGHAHTDSLRSVARAARLHEGPRGGLGRLGNLVHPCIERFPHMVSLYRQNNRGRGIRFHQRGRPRG